MIKLSSLALKKKLIRGLNLDKSTYLLRKAQLSSQLQANTFPKESFCYKCFRLSQNCLCHLIQPFETKIKFVILMHPMEAKKEKIGTGRVCLASLKNSQMIMGIDFTDDQEVNGLIQNPNNYCMTMYPGEKSINVSEHDVSPLKEKMDQEKTLVVFLIDGTWPCAKKMMKLSTNINQLPRVSFTSSKKSIFEIKEQPADFCLSTLESIHFFIEECNRRGLENTNHEEDQMLNVFKEMIKFQIQCSEDPSKSNYARGGSGLGFSKREERVKSQKWLKGARKIIHQES